MAPVSPEDSRSAWFASRNACGIGFNRVGHRQQDGILLGGRKLRQPGRGARAQQLVASRAGSVDASCHRQDFLRCGGK